MKRRLIFLETIGRRFLLLLLMVPLVTHAEDAQRGLVRLLNSQLGQPEGQIAVSWPKGQKTTTQTGAPAWFMEIKPIFIQDAGKPATQTATTTTRINPGDSTTTLGDGVAITQTAPGTARSTTTIQTDAGRESSAYYLHPGIKFCFDADGKSYRWEVWTYPTRGLEPTQFYIDHPEIVWRMVDAWELRTDKKGKPKIVHAMANGRIWWVN